jgi:hypothetical protein
VPDMIDRSLRQTKSREQRGRVLSISKVGGDGEFHEVLMEKKERGYEYVRMSLLHAA